MYYLVLYFCINKLHVILEMIVKIRLKCLKNLNPNNFSRVLKYQSSGVSNELKPIKGIPNSDEVKTNENPLDVAKMKIFELVSVYEEAIGLKEIKEAQSNVLKAEKNFVTAQDTRRALNTELLEIQSRLRDLRDQMERLSRTETLFLKLFTEEHEILKREKFLVHEYKIKESEERDLFYLLSASLRDSQEKERARVERIKYLQLGLSITCTTLGIISAFLMSYYKNSHIKEILSFEKEQFAYSNQLINDIRSKQTELQNIFETNLNALTEARAVQIDTAEIGSISNSEQPKLETIVEKKEINDELKSVETVVTLEPVKELRLYLIASSVILGFLYFLKS